MIPELVFSQLVQLVVLHKIEYGVDNHLLVPVLVLESSYLGYMTSYLFIFIVDFIVEITYSFRNCPREPFVDLLVTRSEIHSLSIFQGAKGGAHFSSLFF